MLGFTQNSEKHVLKAPCNLHAFIQDLSTSSPSPPENSSRHQFEQSHWPQNISSDQGTRHKPMKLLQHLSASLLKRTPEDKLRLPF
jgi:hypothetical protein